MKVEGLDLYPSTVYLLPLNSCYPCVIKSKEKREQNTFNFELLFYAFRFALFTLYHTLNRKMLRFNASTIETFTEGGEQDDQ